MEPADMMAAVTTSMDERPGRSLGYTDALYSGAKAHLRPIHDAIVTVAEGLGDDACREGRGSYIPVVRKTQFVAVAPGPRDTVRVGFRFRDTAPEDERLSPAKGFARATHWLHLAADADEDDLRSLEPLLEAAYRQNG